MNRPRLAAMVLTATLLPTLAVAQINPFRSRWGAEQLRNEDVRLLMDTSRQLLERPTLRDGESETWNNPRTRSSGSVTAERTFQRRVQGKGVTCHTLVYAATVSANAVPGEARLDWCKVGGSWRIAS